MRHIFQVFKLTQLKTENLYFLFSNRIFLKLKSSMWLLERLLTPLNLWHFSTKFALMKFSTETIKKGQINLKVLHLFQTCSNYHNVFSSSLNKNIVDQKSTFNQRYIQTWLRTYVLEQKFLEWKCHVVKIHLFRNMRDDLRNNQLNNNSTSEKFWPNLKFTFPGTCAMT